MIKSKREKKQICLQTSDRHPHPLMAPNGPRARHHEVSTNKTNSLRMRALSQNLQRVSGDMQPAAFKIRYSSHFESRKDVKPLKLLNDIIQANLEKETFPELTIHAILCHQLI